jgi:hypothetical protein
VRICCIGCACCYARACRFVEGLSLTTVALRFAGRLVPGVHVLLLQQLRPQGLPERATDLVLQADLLNAANSAITSPATIFETLNQRAKTRLCGEAPAQPLRCVSCTLSFRCCHDDFSSNRQRFNATKHPTKGFWPLPCAACSGKRACRSGPKIHSFLRIIAMPEASSAVVNHAINALFDAFAHSHLLIRSCANQSSFNAMHRHCSTR